MIWERMWSISEQALLRERERKNENQCGGKMSKRIRGEFHKEHGGDKEVKWI